MSRTEKYKPSKVAEALTVAGGLINHAAINLGCSWNTVKRYIDEHPEVKEAYEEANEIEIDKSESVLFRLRDAAENENVQLGAAKYHLTKKGAKRGYGDKFDVTSDGDKLQGVAITINRGEDD